VCMQWCCLKTRNGKNMKLCTVVLVVIAGDGRRLVGMRMTAMGWSGDGDKMCNCCRDGDNSDGMDGDWGHKCVPMQLCKLPCIAIVG